MARTSPEQTAFLGQVIGEANALLTREDPHGAEALLKKIPKELLFSATVYAKMFAAEKENEGDMANLFYSLRMIDRLVMLSQNQEYPPFKRFFVWSARQDEIAKYWAQVEALTQMHADQNLTLQSKIGLMNFYDVDACLKMSAKRWSVLEGRLILDPNNSQTRPDILNQMGLTQALFQRFRQLTKSSGR